MRHTKRMGAVANALLQRVADLARSALSAPAGGTEPPGAETLLLEEVRRTRALLVDLELRVASETAALNRLVGTLIAENAVLREQVASRWMTKGGAAARPAGDEELASLRPDR